MKGRTPFSTLFALSMASFPILFGWSMRPQTVILTRRSMFVAAMGTVAASTIAIGTSKAACLPGDLSPECIGVYKVPIDDEIRPYVGSQQALEKFAPELKFVPPIDAPKSHKEAMEMLLAQRLAADDIRNVVAAGRLEEAGIKVLNLLPKLTVAGRVAVADVFGNENGDVVGELRQARVQSQFQDLQGLWGGVDVMIGQGIRGDLGVSAVAQLQILQELSDGVRAYDDFLAIVAQKR
jgi:hypothetical protein